MADSSLYDSNVCRLCAEDNKNGELLYSSSSNAEGNNLDLSAMVNRYLPLKIRDDGKLPRTICPGCNIQLEATVQFFELLVDGQKKIREMWKHQVEQRRKLQRERLRVEREKTELALETPELDNSPECAEEQQLEREIIIEIMPDGSMYAADHEMSLQMEGLNRPRRKRGRPPKAHEVKGEEDGKHEEEVDEVDGEGDGRRRRKRKVPKRYMEAVQGKELERIFKEEGVIDEEDEPESEHLEDDERGAGASAPDDQEEVIGHLETEEGKDLGELIIVNRARGRGRPKISRRKHKFTCHQCGRGFLQRSRYIIHKSFHKGTKYECFQCKKQFTSKDNFVLHQKVTEHVGGGNISNCVAEKEDNENKRVLMLTSDSRGTSFAAPGQCKNGLGALENARIDDSHDRDSLPGKSLDSMVGSVGTDEIATNPQLDISCEFCELKFQTEEACVFHVDTVHQDTKKRFNCKICNKDFAHQNRLKEHASIHEGNKAEKGYPCEICGKVLNHPSSVVYHKEAEHNNGRRFVCNKCGKSFKHKQLLQRHQLVHSDDRPYVCKSCNASFKTKANLINHQSTHTGEKKYFCEICGQQFAHKTSLTLHYRWHTGYKPYTCEVCNKSFSQNGNLQEHMRIHTGEKPYCCDYCGRKFTTSSQFKLHVKRHTGERPWKCEFCAKSFLHKDTWKCHVRRHKGERPFQCAHCNRGFTEQWALKKHLRLHTGEKPYSCDTCGKAFADCSNLTKHKKVHRENRALNVAGTEDVENSVAAASGVGEVWQILPTTTTTTTTTTHEVDDISLGEQMTQVIATSATNSNDAAGDGIQQIIYVSYQDPDDPNQSRTLHFVDASLIKTDRDQQELTTTSSAITAATEAKAITTTTKAATTIATIPDKDDEILNACQGSQQRDNAIDSSTEEGGIDMELAESGLQLQITDEAGNPIPLSIQDARHLLSEGQFVRVHTGIIGQELTESLNRHNSSVEMMRVIDNADHRRLENTDPMSAAMQSSTGNTTDAEAIVKALEDEDTDATAVATINHMEGGATDNDGQTEIVDGEQTIEFTTQDGQKVRLVTSYHVDPIQLASEYLTIV